MVNYLEHQQDSLSYPFRNNSVTLQRIRKISEKWQWWSMEWIPAMGSSAECNIVADDIWFVEIYMRIIGKGVRARRILIGTNDTAEYEVMDIWNTCIIMRLEVVHILDVRNIVTKWWKTCNWQYRIFRLRKSNKRWWVRVAISWKAYNVWTCSCA